MDFVNPQVSTVIFGFDSAWLDKNHGAICAITVGDRGQVGFHTPELVNFDEARGFIEKHRRGFDVSLVALDQPTVVPNAEGMRPVEKVAGALLGFTGGGVQPANRKKLAFRDGAPIWSFLRKVGATQDPISARMASTGHFLIEVFPALALPAFENDFAQRHGAPKYNPEKRKKFRLDDWRAVARVVQAAANRFNVNCLADWAGIMHTCIQPKKRHQDMLDAALCALIGLAWRTGSVTCSAMLGDLSNGYMVTH